jgi:hypothetical protein
LRVHGPAPDAIEDGIAVWRRQMHSGSDLGFRMQLAGPAEADLPAVFASLEDTCQAWRSWSELHESYQGVCGDAVRLSGRVLRALASGGEGRREVGRLGHALSVAACQREAAEFLQASLAASMAGPGTARSPAADAGLLDAVAHIRASGSVLSDEQRRHVVGVVDAAAQRWAPAAGQPPAPAEGRRRDTHSAVMDWTVLDRGLQCTDVLDAAAQDRDRAWHSARQEVQLALLTEAWSSSSGCYAQGFGSDVIDSSALWLCLSGLLPATDPRMRSTVEAVAEALSAPCGLLYRYQGAHEQQSPCLASTYWLVQCLARAGETDRAMSILDQATAYASDLGLLAAEGDPTTGELHGAFPDVEAHAGLVNAAVDVEASLSWRETGRALA